MQKVREFTYQRLSPEEQKRRGILGRLVGTIADFKNPTRNDRLYTEELWDNVFQDPIMKEKIRTRTVAGELGHPTDRTETDMEKIAIILAEEPKKCEDGTIKGVFDIIDTPNGRILKSLCDYGCKIGVSSRGTGDVKEDWSSGKQTVDPASYQCECWDAVLLPSVEKARPDYVTESLHVNGDEGLKKALNEDLNTASPEDRRIMESTLKSLNIDISNNGDDIIEEKTVENNTPAADNIGASVVKNLQESLKQIKYLQSQVKALQEKLSVCNAKESKIAETLQNSKFRIEELTRDVMNEKQKSKDLEEQLKEKSALIEAKEAQLSDISKELNEQKNQQKVTKAFNESLNTRNAEAKKVISKLKEDIDSTKQDSIIKEEKYKAKIKQASSLVEHYKKITSLTVDRYIENRARTLGIKAEEIKRRLGESYSLDDVDRVCDDVANIQLNINSLPFNIKSNNNLKVKIKESYEPIKPKNSYDDDIDDQLIYLSKK